MEGVGWVYIELYCTTSIENVACNDFLGSHIAYLGQMQETFFDFVSGLNYFHSFYQSYLNIFIQ
eukprot:TRINITY_DN3332_c1_g1_i2.p1 TRINITY_DN3332_c1_g1~~TRINITY_DN3332_c1_g1_i2.p1  ORF type:complete len:64 (+),score=2.15 TRINITY_DN3332_c1_g1_i2:297-488(+)